MIPSAVSPNIYFLGPMGDPSLALSRVLSSLSIFEDQALKVKRTQRNLSNREALLAKGNSNRQEAKELMQLIDDLKNTSLRADPELSHLEIKIGPEGRVLQIINQLCQLFSLLPVGIPHGQQGFTIGQVPLDCFHLQGLFFENRKIR